MNRRNLNEYDRRFCEQSDSINAYNNQFHEENVYSNQSHGNNDQNIEYDLLDDDDYDSDDIKLEITDYENGSEYTQIYTVPPRNQSYNQKRLICFSILSNEQCNYGLNCTYAHNLEEQVIDPDKKFIYQIVLDEQLMNFFSPTNPKTDDIYKHLLFITRICDKCCLNKCTGGFNCRHGINDLSLKLCKNDLLTGQCLNKQCEITINPMILNKIDDVRHPTKYIGCMNGHHLTTRDLIPYYKYIFQKENTKKNKYQSIRYIDINPINHLFQNEYDNKMSNDYDSDESTDEEVNNWFRKHKTDGF